MYSFMKSLISDADKPYVAVDKGVNSSSGPQKGGRWPR